MASAALQYARAGWSVFPCRERDEEYQVGGETRLRKAKAPYTGAGVKDATTDEAVITGWWKRWPNAMIGVAMGHNGLFALDFDPRVDPDTGEIFTLETLKAELEEMIGCPLPVSLAAVTQSGGVHVYLKQPGDGGPEIRNRGNLPRHVDVRGLGGYVIAPPSVMTETGARYRWLHGRQGMEPADAPARLIEILRSKGQVKGGPGDAAETAVNDPSSRQARTERNGDDPVDQARRRYALTALDSELKELAATPIGGGRHGGRNRGIYFAGLKLGGFIPGGWLSESVVRASLLDVIRAMPNNDDPQGAEKTMENGLRDGMASPHDMSGIGVRAGTGRHREGASRHSPPPPDAASGDPGPFRPGGSGGSSAYERDAGEIDRACAYKPMTDLGNAERFYERFGNDFRWSVGLGWLGWDGRRWAVLSQDEKTIPAAVLDAVFRTVRAIQDESQMIAKSGAKKPDVEFVDEDTDKSIKLQWSNWEKAGEPPDAMDYIVEVKSSGPVWFSEKLAKWGRTSESSAKLGCIANLARSWLAVEEKVFDRDPFAINVLNGTLHFRRERGEDGKWKVGFNFTCHRREDLITRLAPVEFERSAVCPHYDALLEWAQPDADMRRYLHAWAGLSMTGDMGEQKLQFWYGLGGNGKSTVIDAWCSVIGDYAATVGIETFLDQGVKKRGDQASPDLAALGGVRMLRTSEPEDRAKLASALIKLVTGGEPMMVRFLNRGFFELRPQFKLTISGNHKLSIPDTDNGIWRRVRMIGWHKDIEQEVDANGRPRKDEDLPKKLALETSGIFNRLITGLLDWMHNGLVEPEQVRQETSEYREASDPLSRFLKLCTKPSPQGRARSGLLHTLFKAWAKAAQEREWSPKGFASAMEAKGFKKKASDGMWWLGIEMIREPSEFVDEQGNPKPFSIDDDPVAAPSPPPPAPFDPWQDDDDVPF